MKKIWLQSLLFLLLFSVGLFGIKNPTKASDILGADYDGGATGGGDFVYNNRYQRFNFAQDNVSEIYLESQKTCGGPANIYLNIWDSSNTLIGTSSPTWITNSNSFYLFDFPTPLGLIPSTDYFISASDCLGAAGWKTISGDFIYTWSGSSFNAAFSNVTGRMSVYYDDTYVAGPPACTSFTYTNWGACDGYNQVRNIATYTPTDCEGGATPVLGQSCFTGTTEVIQTTQPIYYNDTNAQYNIMRYVYSTRVSVGDYINIYKFSGTSTETFISSSSIIDLTYGDLPTMKKQDGLSWFNLIGTSTLYQENVFTYYHVVPILSGVGAATTTFPVYWTNDTSYFYEQQGQGIITPIGTTTTSLWTENPHDFVCSADDWASGSWWINLKCGTAETFLVIIGKITNGLGRTLSLTGTYFANLFPFNLAYKINQSWITATTGTLPDELSVLNVADANGNVKVNLPTEWIATGSITLWGSDVWNANAATTSFFTFIKVLSKYLMWILFIWFIVNLGHEMFDEIRVEKTLNDRRKEDYQL